KIVGRPCGSALVVSNPRGLLNRKRRVRSRMGNGLSSTLIWSSGVTLSAGELITAPLTATRPAAIQVSASRREQRPARAIILAIPSEPSCGGGNASGTARGSVVFSLLGRNLRPRWWLPPLLLSVCCSVMALPRPALCRAPRPLYTDHGKVVHGTCTRGG